MVLAVSCLLTILVVQIGAGVSKCYRNVSGEARRRRDLRPYIFPTFIVSILQLKIVFFSPHASENKTRANGVLYSNLVITLLSLILFIPPRERIRAVAGGVKQDMF